MNVLGAGRAIFCPAGAGEIAPAADCAAAEFFRAEDGLFQLRLLGQHGAAKPPAKQATGDVLRANAVQVCECKAACVVDIVASIV